MPKPWLVRVLVALALALTVSVVAAPAGRADHTPTPSVVALVGSLQSELGCPNDWAPECPATRLTPVDGAPGVYRGTFDVPAGSYEYKVALNGSWDENYGSGGAPGGANIPLTATGGPITFTYDHVTHVISDDTPKKPASERGAHWLRTDVLAWAAPDWRGDVPAAHCAGRRPGHRRRADRRDLVPAHAGSRRARRRPRGGVPAPRDLRRLRRPGRGTARRPLVADRPTGRGGVRRAG